MKSYSAAFFEISIRTIGTSATLLSVQTREVYKWT